MNAPSSCIGEDGSEDGGENGEDGKDGKDGGGEDGGEDGSRRFSLPPSLISNLTISLQGCRVCSYSLFPIYVVAAYTLQNSLSLLATKM